MSLFGIVKQATNPKDPSLTICTTKCPFCKKTEDIEVRTRSLINYAEGYFIQDAFSYLDKDKREQLLTGYCSTCWDRIFGDEDE